MSLRILPLLALITPILLAGCGVKGELTLPDARASERSEAGDQ